MFLALEFANARLYGGLFEGAEIVLRFRKAVGAELSADEIGLFLRTVLRERGVDPEQVDEVAFTSVVPELNPAIVEACQSYFHCTPFTIRPGVKTGLKIKYANPRELGADRIATAVGACSLYGVRNMVVVSLGTVTTFDVITEGREYAGGVIIPGIKSGMHDMGRITARLPTVELCRPKEIPGRTTEGNIQSGLYWGTVGAIREICTRIEESCFAERPALIGGGEFAPLFDKAGIFTILSQDLVLHGLFAARELNR